jgi:hypothetical protein
MAGLTDKDMKAMMPLFVENTAPPDHKCGGCFMRVPVAGGTAGCTVVEGEINLDKGTCVYWAKGDASSIEDIHASRMSKETAGYVEHDGDINCGSCHHHNDGHCTLWMGDVKPGQCCISWENRY